MKMSKKVREYKAGDFIFAKVKGYPAWPARVQRMNGKKYFVYFYGTGETANLPPNMIFDYAENKDKFLTKSVKRRDFNDGVKQIEYDFANNVPLEQVIGVPAEVDAANDTVNESTTNETLDTSMADTTAADETMAEESTNQNDTGIEDSDETGALVIDEGKQGKAAKKSTPKTPATPKAKEPKTPRGRNKKEEESKEESKEEEKKEEEIVSRSGRKIRPKRYIDEHTEDNTTLPTSAPKKRRGASPVEKEKEKEKEKEPKEKNIKQFNAVAQTDLENLKEPFIPDDPEKENIIIAYLPSGQYIGIKLFQSRPNSFKNEAARLQWDKQAASNALTLKSQLEKDHISPQSMQAQLVMDLNLTDEEKATLDKDRDTEEKKSRMNYLKVEMKLIELDAKIKTCLCLEKANTELCLKLLDELMTLDIKPLMLLKHPSTPETIKRMRAYVGNTPQWELTESDALLFSQHAHKIRQQADVAYNYLKGLFDIPQGLSFWEFFTGRVDQFKKATEKLTPDEILEMVHEPLEMSLPTSHTMKTAIDAANEQEKEEEEETKKTKTPAKTKKVVNNTPSKTPAKRQSSRNKPEEKKEKEQTNSDDVTEDTNVEQKQDEPNKDKESQDSKENDVEEKEVTKDKKEKKTAKDSKSKEDKSAKETKANKDDSKSTKNKTSKEVDISTEKDSNEEEPKDTYEKDKEEKGKRDSEIREKTPENSDVNTDDPKKDSSVDDEKNENSKEVPNETEKDSKSTEKSDKEEKKEDKEKLEDEPRAKRSRESKKTDPPPRSPTKRKSKF